MSAAQLWGSLGEPAPAPPFPERPCADHLEMLLLSHRARYGVSARPLLVSYEAFIFGLTFPVYVIFTFTF